MHSARDTPERVGCPIRTSADQQSLASPRGLSQRATSFIASWHQGIHQTPLSCSRSQPPPPACRTKPRPPGRASCTRGREAAPFAHAHSHSQNYTTNSGFICERTAAPSARNADGACLLEAVPDGTHDRSHAPRPGASRCAHRRRTPAARASRPMRHRQDVGASRVESGAGRRPESSGLAATRMPPHPCHDPILERR